MNRIKIGFLVSSLIVLATLIIVPFFLDNSFGSAELAWYIVAKVVLGITLIVSTVYAFLSNAKNGTSTVLCSLALGLQIVPLGLRYILLSNSDSKFVWYTLILALCLIVYIVLATGLSFQSNKMEKREEIAKGQEIEIQEEKRLATDEENK